MDGCDSDSDKLVRLDDQGDLVVVVRDADRVKSRKFLASSKVLSIASPVFAAMLGPNFQEGDQLKKTREKGATATRPTIHLEEDDVNAMYFILSHIHFKTDRIGDISTASEIIDIAVQSDKYDCNVALAPWIRLWCHPDRFPIDSKNEVRDMGYGLLAAYLFKSPGFLAMPKSYVKDLPPDFDQHWSSYKCLSRLPRTVQDNLLAEIAHSQQHLRLKVLSVVEEFLDKGHKCQSPAPPVAGYTVAKPAAQYIRALKSLGIWPELLPFDRYSVNKVVAMIQKLPDSLGHTCIQNKTPNCRFRDALDVLIQSVCKVRDEMKGVTLEAASKANAQDENSNSG